MTYRLWARGMIPDYEPTMADIMMWEREEKNTENRNQSMMLDLYEIMAIAARR